MRLKDYAIVVGMTVALAACSNNVRDPSEDAEKALRGANLSDVNVEWDDDARIAHLKGTVETSADRQRAEEVVSSAVGTSGRVLNELSVKGLNEAVADDLDGGIKSTLDEMIEREQVLRDRDVNFDVANGVVTVTGEVRTVEEKTRVTELVRSAPGVKDMANALEVKPAR